MKRVNSSWDTQYTARTPIRNQGSNRLIATLFIDILTVRKVNFILITNAFTRRVHTPSTAPHATSKLSHSYSVLKIMFSCRKRIVNW